MDSPREIRNSKADYMTDRPRHSGSQTYYCFFIKTRSRQGSGGARNKRDGRNGEMKASACKLKF